MQPEELVLHPPNDQLLELANQLRVRGINTVHRINEFHNTAQLTVNQVVIELFPPEYCFDVNHRGVVRDPGNRPWQYAMSGWVGNLGGSNFVDTIEEVVNWINGGPILLPLIQAVLAAQPHPV
jgi:hypothetical protein